MKSLDLFSGIGGFALGFHWAGIETAAFCEIEDYPVKVLNKNFPGVLVHRDIRELDGKEYKGIDIITGGFPCQPHSLAGKRLASEDSRDLWGEMYRVICEARPEWIVAENVPGLLSSESGRYFGRVLRDLDQAGYCVQWFCIPASAVGAWHKRERIWIVANSMFSGRNRGAKEQENLDSKDEAGNADKLERSSGASRNVSYCHDIGATIQNFWKLSSVELFGSEGKTRRTFKTWAVEPGVGRVANGVPNRTHRIKGLGNAVVPQIPYLIGKAILETIESP
jgi:DNA (cytosine-5)-methyltransferase 1